MEHIEMTKPLVSVVMPVYNGEKYLAEAINSIIAQTYPHWELLVVDDNSVDASMDIVRSYKDSRIRVIDKKDQPRGVVKSRNMAIDAAKGKYIATMDMDDVSYPEKFEKLVNYLEENEDTVLVGSYFDICDSEMNLISQFTPSTDHSEIIVHQLLFNQFGHSAVMFKTDPARIIKYDENTMYSSDYDLWVKLSKVGEVKNLSESLTGYRRHGNSASVKYFEQMCETDIYIFSYQLKELGLEPVEAIVNIVKTLKFGKPPDTALFLAIVNTLSKCILANNHKRIFDETILGDYFAGIIKDIYVTSFKKDVAISKCILKSPLAKFYSKHFRYRVFIQYIRYSLKSLVEIRLI